MMYMCRRRPGVACHGWAVIAIFLTIHVQASFTQQGSSNLCIAVDLQGNSGAASAAGAVAALAAVSDFNARFCLAPDTANQNLMCNMSYGALQRVHVDPIVVNYGGSEGSMAALAGVRECYRRGAEAVYVQGSDEQVSHMASLAASVGMFTATGRTDLSSSSSDHYPLLIRGSGPYVPVNWLLAMIDGFGWPRMLVLRSDTSFGSAIHEEFEHVIEDSYQVAIEDPDSEEGEEFGPRLELTVATFREDEHGLHVDEALDVAKSGKHKLMIIASDYARVDELIFRADDDGMFSDGYVWLAPWNDAEVAEHIAASDDKPRAARLFAQFLRISQQTATGWSRDELTASMQRVGPGGFASALAVDWATGQQGASEVPLTAGYEGAITLGTANIYDAVFATCMGLDFVAAQSATGGAFSPPGRADTVTDVPPYIAGQPAADLLPKAEGVLAFLTGGLEFSGASGRVSFDGEGNRRSDLLVYAIEAGMIDAAFPEVVQTIAVGQYHARGGGLEYYDGVEFTWPGGRKTHPGHVPDVSFTEKANYTILFAVTTISVLFILGGIFATYIRWLYAQRQNPLYGVDVNKVLKQVYEELLENKEGEVATYIPELACVDPDQLGIAIVTVSGKVYKIGAVDEKFTLQSTAKPFMYAFLMMKQGEDYAKFKINVEPSGDAFNSDKLHPDGRPYNPLINQGAISSMALSFTRDPREDPKGLTRFSGLILLLNAFANAKLIFDHKVYASESKTGDQNRKIAKVLRESGVIENNTDQRAGLNAYFMGCSVTADVVDLAWMGATLANKGIQPKSKKRVIDPEIAQAVTSVMLTCGMYNGAGNWMRDVGLPAKSGVSGCLMAVVPGSCAIAVFSPRLNEHGNSVRGMEVCKKLSKDLSLHVLKKQERTESRKDKDSHAVDRENRRKMRRSRTQLSSSNLDSDMTESNFGGTSLSNSPRDIDNSFSSFSEFDSYKEISYPEDKDVENPEVPEKSMDDSAKGQVDSEGKKKEGFEFQVSGEGPLAVATGKEGDVPVGKMMQTYNDGAPNKAANGSSPKGGSATPKGILVNRPAKVAPLPFGEGAGRRASNGSDVGLSVTTVEQHRSTTPPPLQDVEDL